MPGLESATPDEAAALIAAVEQFLSDTTVIASGEPERQNPWLRAALLEQTGREPDAPSPWGDPHPWGR